MIAARPDLLVIGGLAVDRLADGRTVAGGSVLHAARAVVAAGRRVATITTAGPEPEARAAIAELAALGPSQVFRTATSIRYAIHEEGNRRTLVLESQGATVPMSAAAVAAINPTSVLLAPIAGELTAHSVRSCEAVPVRVAALQGWLRRLVPGQEASPLGLSSLDRELLTALAELDALVASDEDLSSVATNAQHQIQALRARLGPRALLVVTAGAAGAWVDDPSSGLHQLPAVRRLADRSTVGAGDAFAALLTTGLGAGLDRLVATRAAMQGTMEHLERRRP